MTRNRWLVVLTGGILVIAAFGIAALVQTTTRTASASGPSTKADIAVLADSGPSAAATLQGFSFLKTAGYDLEGSRLALTAPDGTEIIALTRSDPGTLGLADGHLMCHVTIPLRASVDAPRGAAAPCATINHFNRYGLISTLGEKGDVSIAGIVPDGVSTITVTFADGSSREVPVTHNAVFLETSQDTRTVAFDGPGGHVEQDATPFKG